MQTFEQTTLKQFILFYKVDQSAINRVLLVQAIQILSYFRLNQLAKKNLFQWFNRWNFQVFETFTEQIIFPKIQIFLSKLFKLWFFETQRSKSGSDNLSREANRITKMFSFENIQVMKLWKSSNYFMKLTGQQ